MILNSLHIENFRSIDSKNLYFNKINCVDNKDILDAISIAVSFIFHSPSTTDKNDIKCIRFGMTEVHIKNFNKNDDGKNKDYISLNASGEFLNETLEWEMYAGNKTYKIHYSKFKDAFNKFYNKCEETNTIPLIAYYNNFPNYSIYEGNIYGPVVETSPFSYYRWDKNFPVNMVIKRLRDLEITIFNESKDLKNKDKYQSFIDGCSQRLKKSYDEHEYIKNKIIECSNFIDEGKIISIFVDTFKKYDLMLTFENDKKNKINLKKLSEKSQKLITITLSTAYKLYKNRKKDAPGIIMIENIDKESVDILNSIFPNLQFFYTLK